MTAPSAAPLSLGAGLAAIRQALARAAGLTSGADSAAPAAGAGASSTAPLVDETDGLERLSSLFGLTPFERDVLLLCAGVELDPTMPALCAAAHGDPRQTAPTFGLALATLPQPDWAALTPGRPLRHWQLIILDDERALTHTPLRIDERILHVLTGTGELDAVLVGPLSHVPPPPSLVPSHARLAESLAHTWAVAPDLASEPVLQLCGPDAAAKRQVAAAVCDRLGRALVRIAAEDVPPAAAEFDAFLRRWERDAVLANAALLVEYDEAADAAEVQRSAGLRRLFDQARTPLLVATRDRLPSGRQAVVTVEVARPEPAEQRALWQAHLGELGRGLEAQLDALVDQFDLSEPAIQAACVEAAGALAAAGLDGPAVTPDQVGEAVWSACRAQARPRLGELAQSLQPSVAWDDLVLPTAGREVLEQIVVHVQQRRRVNDEWGFAARSSRGLGISALFAGPSGTGKTMAAEVLASQLRLDLFRVDLSATVSKYIGETEKNLRRIFDAADSGGAILLFDEADALFGKRSEVKDSHDRYANIEVSYLLQRMEAYRGLAILTTNLEDALDSAFVRRIRFIVRFPHPDEAERAEIWRRVFPPALPQRDVDPAKLARLNAAGGTIRNIALGAAALAAVDGGPLEMRHLLRAAQTEYVKLKRPLPATETRDWLA